MKWATLVLVPIGVFLILWFPHWTHMKATTPPPGLTLAKYLDIHPDPVAVHKVSIDGKTFITITGPMAKGDWDIPSGPPVYIFTAKGELADWTDDNNEGRSLAPYLKAFPGNGCIPEGSTKITVEEARQIEER